MCSEFIGCLTDASKLYFLIGVMIHNVLELAGLTSHSPGPDA